ncbi:MAG TPA: VOC family protein [Dehalococcoidia bacterium]|nr:VOC family protein [Dehalococcoidia bacterium]
MGRPVVHFEIHGKDGKRLQEFYGKLFDWSVDANNPMNYGMVAPASAGMGGGITAGDAPMVTVYVEVPELAAALASAESLGGKTVMPPMDVPGGPTIAMFQDPEGNTVGLIKAGSMAAAS